MIATEQEPEPALAIDVDYVNALFLQELELYLDNLETEPVTEQEHDR